MKTNSKFYLLISLLVLAVSCKDPEVEVNPIIGKWTIDSYSFVNMPSNYTIWEGYELSSLYGELAYSLEFENDLYTRSVRLGLIKGGDTTISESGEWTSDGDFLTLDPTGSGLPGILGVGFDNNFKITTSTTKDLVISAETEDWLYADTVTEAYYNWVWDLADSTSEHYDTVLWSEKVNELYKLVIFDLEYDFDRVN